MNLRLFPPTRGFSGPFIVLGAALVFSGAPACAHDPGLSVASAALDQGTIRLHLAMARSDLERLVTLDADHDGKISEQEFQAVLPRLEGQARRSFEVTGDGRKLTLSRVTVQRDEQDG